MPNVLCWESVVADEAAKLFSVEFFKALEKDGSYDSPQLHPNQDPDPILNPNANPKPNPNPNPSPIPRPGSSPSPKPTEHLPNIQQDPSYSSAFEFAKVAVTDKTRDGKTEAGMDVQVACWELRAPKLVNKRDVSVSTSKYSPKPEAAGVPRLLQSPAVSPTPLAITRSRSA